MLRWPNPQIILTITFSSALLNTSTAVIGAQMGVAYSMDDLSDDGWVLILAYVVAFSVLFWYVTQVRYH